MSVMAQQVYFGDPDALSSAVVTSHANIDPIFYIDPDFLAAHPDATIVPNGSFLFDTQPGGSTGGDTGGGDPGGVPEPAAWALMIMGFGFAGASLRRRKALFA
ncbi:MAG: PEP-CTERM sorting domain-containing protein [Proteobacteria bacterium]|nr:PEP-CTERM sorting domain-containing protein [Pseudomonadota bacterium]